jgi:predicted O-methyltransferase YrrM
MRGRVSAAILKCEMCRYLISMTPDAPWTREYLEDKFKEIDPWKYQETAYEKVKYQRQLEVIRDRRPDASAILEIGPAEGVFTAMLADQFSSTTIQAVEISQKACERASERLRPYSSRVRLVNADIIDHESQIAASSYDVILWSESVYYIGARLTLNNTYDLLRRMVDKLMPGGLLLMANTVELPKDVPESAVTNRQLIDCYYHLLESLISPASRAIYVEEKQGRIYEYQIWAFIR